MTRSRICFGGFSHQNNCDVREVDQSLELLVCSRLLGLYDGAKMRFALVKQV